MRRSSSQEAALALAAKTAQAIKTATGQWGPFTDVRRRPRQGAALAVAAKARDVMKGHTRGTAGSRRGDTGVAIGS